MAPLVRALLDQDQAVTCGPVLFEIRRGLKPAERKRILPLFGALRRLGLEEGDWARAGDLDASLRKDGKTLPAMAVLIAYLCLQHRVSILTLEEHFESVPGLRVNTCRIPAR